MAISICIEGQNGTGKTTLACLLEDFLSTTNTVIRMRKLENKTKTEKFCRKWLKRELSQEDRLGISRIYADDMIKRAADYVQSGCDVIIDKCPVINTSIYNSCLYGGTLDTIENDELFSIFDSYNFSYDLFILIIPPVNKIRKNILTKIDKDQFDNPDLLIEKKYRKFVKQLNDGDFISKFAKKIYVIDEDLSIEETFIKVKSLLF